LSHKDSHHTVVNHRVDNNPVLLSTEKILRTKKKEEGGFAPSPPPPPTPSGDSSGGKRKGSGPRSTPPHKTIIPPDLALNEAMLSFATTRGMSAEAAADEFQRFVAWHMKEGKLSANWEASWRTWVLNHFKFKQRDAEKAAAERPARKDPEGLV